MAMGSSRVARGRKQVNPMGPNTSRWRWFWGLAVLLVVTAAVLAVIVRWGFFSPALAMAAAALWIWRGGPAALDRRAWRVGFWIAVTCVMCSAIAIIVAEIQH